MEKSSGQLSAISGQLDRVEFEGIGWLKAES
jgi:hypothetical protein